MSKNIKRIEYIENGDYLVEYRIYECAKCGKEIGESYPIEEIDNSVYCGDCAFLDDLISEKEYIKNHLFFIGDSRLRACVKDGKIYIGSGKFPWEKTDREIRNSKENTEWRTAVFERDKYTCVICKKVGGRLNAHHIKPFSKFPNDRFDIDNGITLCEKCHKRVHKEKDPAYTRE